MKITVTKSTFFGSLPMPPSKSCSHRHFICSALCNGASELTNFASSDDVLTTESCIKSFGATVKRAGDVIRITGVSGIPNNYPGFYAGGASGSTLRMIAPLTLINSVKSNFVCTERLVERCYSDYSIIAKAMNINVIRTNNGLSFSGRLVPGTYTLPGDLSSQYISGMLLALPVLSADSELHIIPPIESKGYIKLTLSIMQEYGITVIEPSPFHFVIPGNQKYRAGLHFIENDWSNAAPFYALNYINDENCVIPTELNPMSMQGDKNCIPFFEELKEKNAIIDICDNLDLAPILFVVAAVNNGGTFCNTKRLSNKESDRISCMVEELGKFGCEVKVSENEATVKKVQLHAPTEPINCHDDHRIAMAMYVLLTLFGGELEDAECVTKSFPDFFENIESIKKTL